MKLEKADLVLPTLIIGHLLFYAGVLIPHPFLGLTLMGAEIIVFGLLDAYIVLEEEGEL